MPETSKDEKLEDAVALLNVLIHFAVSDLRNRFPKDEAAMVERKWKLKIREIANA